MGVTYFKPTHHDGIDSERERDERQLRLDGPGRGKDPAHPVPVKAQPAFVDRHTLHNLRIVLYVAEDHW